MPSNFQADIHYNVNVESIAGHLFRVALSIRNPDPNGQELSLPSWIPGSYMIRDFSKNIITLCARTRGGRSLIVDKLDKLTWKIEKSEEEIHIDYLVYAFDLSVRSAYICDEYAFFNGTSVFLKAEGKSEQPCHVNFEQPQLHSNWQVATTLPLANATKHHQFGEYRADNYAALIDHPVLFGEYDIVPFTVNDIQFELILAGGHNADCERMANDLTKICQHHLQLFPQNVPINRYLFITLLTHDGFGGLEHNSSTTLMYARDDLPSVSVNNQITDGYRTFLSLCSHELFHTWHVKRIKPTILKQSELKSESYTEQLWIYEGFTSYYDDLSLLRCGIIDSASYLELLGQNLTRLYKNKGRLKQSVTQSSFDAWTKFYQQDASAINNIVSYYNKGAIIAFCLDMMIRTKSDDLHSLDTIMQMLWTKFGVEELGTDDDVIHQLLNELQLDLNSFLQLALYSTQELPIDECLHKIGLKQHFRASSGSKDKGGKDAEKTITHQFGASFKASSMGIEITQVVEDTAAYMAGLQVGDIVIAASHKMVTQDNIQNILDTSATGSSIELHVFRDKKLKCFNFSIQTAPKDTIYLTIEDESTMQTWIQEHYSTLGKY